MRRAALVCLLALAGPLWGQKVTVEKEVKVPVGRLASVVFDWEGSSLKWTAPDDIDVFREYDQDVTKVRLRVLPYKAGRYKLSAIASGKDGKLSDFAHCTVIAGNPEPTPPDPPGPGPGPGPEPLPPDDPLVKALTGPYAADTDPQKDAHRKALAALYEQGETAAKSATVTTWGQLFDVMKAAAGTLGVSGKLTAVQAVIGNELKKTLPSERSKALDATGRDLAAKEFKRIGAALEALK